MQRYIAIYLPIYSFAKIQLFKDISKQKIQLFQKIHKLL